MSLLLYLRPGITGPASLKYSNEEELLALQEDPIKSNNEVIFPDQVRINLKKTIECPSAGSVNYFYDIG